MAPCPRREISKYALSYSKTCGTRQGAKTMVSVLVFFFPFPFYGGDVRSCRGWNLWSRVKFMGTILTHLFADTNFNLSCKLCFFNEYKILHGGLHNGLGKERASYTYWEREIWKVDDNLIEIFAFHESTM